MKKTPKTMLAVLLATGLAAPAFAADPPVIPADPPGAKSETKKKAAASKSAATKPAAKKGDEVVKLPSPEPAVVSQKNVNVRGQAKINSEVVTRLNKGDKITVLEEITTQKKANEPDRWYKISLPPTSAAWVFANYLDTDKKVKPNRLNIRSGPGENFSVIGLLEKGAAVNVVETKGEWLKIEPPASAYAFVAAHLVTLEPAPPVIAKTDPPPPPPIAEVPVAPPPTVAVAQDPPPPVIPVSPTPPAGSGIVAHVQPTPPGPPPEEPLAKRVVTREGIIKSSVSIQAPSHYVLRGLENGKTINYLYSPPTNDLAKVFWGKKVLVTGEEVLDERWPNTPVIEIETIQELQEPEAKE